MAALRRGPVQALAGKRQAFVALVIPVGILSGAIGSPFCPLASRGGSGISMQPWSSLFPFDGADAALLGRSANIRVSEESMFQHAPDPLNGFC